MKLLILCIFFELLASGVGDLTVVTVERSRGDTRISPNPYFRMDQGPTTNYRSDPSFTVYVLKDITDDDNITIDYKISNAASETGGSNVSFCDDRASGQDSNMVKLLRHGLGIETEGCPVPVGHYGKVDLQFPFQLDVVGVSKVERIEVSLGSDLFETDLCPSSPAAWFHQRGCSVSLCRQRYSQRLEYSCKIPSLDKGCSKEKFFEWLGIFSIGGNVTNEDPDNYVSGYTPPSSDVTGPVLYAEWTGLFSSKRVMRIYEAVKNYMEKSDNSTTWLSLHVGGFADSPVSWGLKEHSYYVDGDNSFTIVFQNNGERIMQKSLSSNNKPRNFQ